MGHGRRREEESEGHCQRITCLNHMECLGKQYNPIYRAFRTRDYYFGSWISLAEYELLCGS
jgi:hypothetical protein